MCRRVMKHAPAYAEAAHASDDTECARCSKIDLEICSHGPILDSRERPGRKIGTDELRALFLTIVHRFPPLENSGSKFLETVKI